MKRGGALTCRVADISKPRMSDASTLFSMFFQLGMGLGVAIGALLLRGAMRVHGNTGQVATADFQLVFFGVAVIAMLALLDNLRLPKDAAQAVLQRD